MLVGDLGCVEMLLHAQHSFFCWLKQSIQTANDRHRQDYIAVLAAHIDIAQHVIGDAPDEIHNGGVGCVVHPRFLVLVLLFMAALPIPSHDSGVSACFSTREANREGVFNSRMLFPFALLADKDACILSTVR